MDADQKPRRTPQIALIATLPKSGTWYSRSFFWCYEQLVRNQDAFLAGNYKPDMLSAFRHHDLGDKVTRPEIFGLSELFICHSVCPGFHESGDERYHEWSALHFPLPYNWGESYVRDYKSWNQLNPAVSSGAKVMYLCRNPLDHFVSYYTHAQNHIFDDHRYKFMTDGTRIPIHNLHDFVFDFGILAAFIKHYYSFRQMARSFPDQVKIISYNDLTMKPEETFRKMLAFIGAPVDTKVKDHLFSEALRMCSKKSMMSIESKMNRSIAGDQKGNGKHVRDGATGKWRNHFSRQDLERIESVFRLFDISLNDFQLDENNTGASLPWLSELDERTVQTHQAAFMRQQLAFAGMRLTSQEMQLEKIHRPLKALKSLKRDLYTAPKHAVGKVIKKNLASFGLLEEA